MSLQKLLEQGKIVHHTTSPQEIQNLLNLVRRDIEDAAIPQLSADRRFATAYNAALQLGTILLYGNGFKTRGVGHLFHVFQAMKDILGIEYHELADYFDSCRSKRNIADYMSSGTVSDAEVQELIREVTGFHKTVTTWVKKNYPRSKR
jgi:uncharacterized protein (UPF0332 family)